MNTKPAPTELDRISKLYGLPEFFKQAGEDGTWVAPSGYDSYVDDARTLPIHTASATYLSCVSAFESGFGAEKRASAQDGSDLQETLLKVARFWGIGDAVENNIVKKFQQMKVASSADIPDSSFALAVDHPVDGSRVRAYPIETPAMIEKSAAALIADRTRMPLAQRKQAAVAILNRASELGMNLLTSTSDILEKTAGIGLGTPDDMADALYKRASVFAERHQMDLARETTFVADTVLDSEISPEFCCKVAEAIDQLDADHQLHLRYGFGLDLPEDACHSILEGDCKRASAEYFRLPTGSVYRTDDLMKVAHILPAICGADHGKMIVDGSFSKSAAAKAMTEIPMGKVGQLELLFAQFHLERQSVPSALFA